MYEIDTPSSKVCLKKLAIYLFGEFVFSLCQHRVMPRTRSPRRRDGGDYFVRGQTAAFDAEGQRQRSNKARRRCTVTPSIYRVHSNQRPNTILSNLNALGACIYNVNVVSDDLKGFTASVISATSRSIPTASRTVSR
jgi:hypothetical protein